MHVGNGIATRRTGHRPAVRHSFTPARLALLAAAALAVGCGSGDSTGPGGSTAVASVTVSPASASLGVGATEQFSARATDGTGAAVTNGSISWSSSDATVATVDSKGLATGKSVGTTTITATVGAVSGTAALSVTTPIATLTLTPSADTVVVREGTQLTAVAKDSAGNVVSGAFQWSSSDTMVAVVDADGAVSTRSAGHATITASVGGKTATAALTVKPAFLSVRGLFAQIEHRSSTYGYYNGELLQDWGSTEQGVGIPVASEVAAQFDAMRALGVNTITFEVRTTDDSMSSAGFVPPDCNLPPLLGLTWPTPEAAKLANLVSLFDLAQQKGIKIVLFLVNTHMEQPADSNAEWLGPILDAVGQHPALSLVLFNGNTHIDPSNNQCGTPAEPPLWLGSTAQPAEYVQWAIGFARDRGVSTTKLSAEALVGIAAMNSTSPAGSYATGSHLWDPVAVLKQIFDNLQIPDAERTYALSFYERQKCAPPTPDGCVDETPSAWAEETVRSVFGTIGWSTKATVVATEMGVFPTDPTWPTAQGVDDLLTLLETYGVAGGSVYRWTTSTNDEESDPSVPMPVKMRGLAYSYTAVKDVLVKHYLQ